VPNGNAGIISLNSLVMHQYTWAKIINESKKAPLGVNDALGHLGLIHGFKVETS
jgi:hypothetical protein